LEKPSTTTRRFRYVARSLGGVTPLTELDLQQSEPLVRAALTSISRGRYADKKDAYVLTETGARSLPSPRRYALLAITHALAYALDRPAQNAFDALAVFRLVDIHPFDDRQQGRTARCLRTI